MHVPEHCNLTLASIAHWYIIDFIPIAREIQYQIELWMTQDICYSRWPHSKLFFHWLIHVDFVRGGSRLLQCRHYGLLHNSFRTLSSRAIAIVYLSLCAHGWVGGFFRFDLVASLQYSLFRETYHKYIGEDLLDVFMKQCDWYIPFAAKHGHSFLKLSPLLHTWCQFYTTMTSLG